MAKPEMHHKTKVEDSSSLKGTLASVMILGAILIGSWFWIWSIFVDR